MPITLMATTERVVNLYKLINSHVKNNFRFATISDMNGRTLRNSNDIYIPNPYSRSNSEYSSLTLACKEYNEISFEARRLTDVRLFKMAVKLEVMSKCDVFRALSPFLFLN